MSFVLSAVSPRAPKRFAFRTFAITLTTALIVLFLPGTAFAVGEPSAPAQPTVTHGDGTITVSFVAPADNGSAILFYTATCTSSDGGAAGSNSATASPILVSGVDNGKAYTCTVNATNANGTSSSSVQSATTVPAAVPETTLKPTVTRGNTQISVAFVAQGDNGSAITGFTASCTSSDGGVAGSNSGATSPIVVSTLTNGKTYTCTVFATNAEGNSPPSQASSVVVPATVPTTPAQPTVVHGDAGISVTFTPSSGDGGSLITGYTASCTSSDGGAAGTASASGSPILVSALTNGKTYTCTVHGTNAVGNSLESVASASTVPATVPAAPAQPTVTRGDSQLSVAFGAPANGGSTITGYTATCTSSDGGAAGSNSGATSPIVVSTLTNGKTYTCTVLATNTDGSGTASSASGSAVPAAVPSAPAAAVLTRGNAQISVAFVAPAANGSAITGYTASCTSSDGGTTGSNTGSSSPIVVFALTNGKSYTCAVVATNAVGDGLPSSTSATAVPATVPGTPAIPTLTRGNAAISVAFVAPASGGTAITGYTAGCTSSDGGTAGSSAGGGSPIFVSSLTNGKTYTCTVLATNAVGSGSASNASASAVPAATPSAPARPTITRGNGLLNVTFVAPANGGSIITDYLTRCVSSDGGVTHRQHGARSPIVNSGLTNGKLYTCTVHAINAAGAGAESVESLALRVGVPPSNTDLPRIRGAAINGRTLTAYDGYWRGQPRPAITRQWQRCNLAVTSCVNMRDAVGTTYVLRSFDVGYKIRLVVRATNALGSASAISAATARVVNG